MGKARKRNKSAANYRLSRLTAQSPVLFLLKNLKVFYFVIKFDYFDHIFF
jgi:hypothetical protein